MLSLLVERCPLPKRITLPFIVQGEPPYRGLVERKREREREREREFPCPDGWGRQLCQLGSPTLSVGVLVQPPPKSYVAEWPSCSVPICHALSVRERACIDKYV
jgi:hypothetical protein